MKKKQFYNLSNDYLFKLIFSNKYHLKKLLLDGFGITIDEFHYTKESLTKDNKNLSVGVFDIIIETENKIIIVEMQNRSSKSFENRAMIYATRKYSDGLKKMKKAKKDNQKKAMDDIYANIKPIICCWILNYDYDNQKKELLKFRMLEEKIHKRFGESIKIMLLSLKAPHQSEFLNDFELLANAENIVELNNLKSKKEFKGIVEDIRYYNMDEKMYKKMERIRRMKERYEEDLLIASADAYHEGKSVGKNEGIKLGEKRGEKRGEKLGEERKKIEIAKNLLSENVDLELVMKTVGLNQKEIQNILLEINNNQENQISKKKVFS